ncbi:MAG: hypothetical protein EOO62_11520 [Hymenobacter sp.]|nr:MAG: hypothetical protein EOO62_11520 [Hymenobacter sp.]
MRKTYLLLLLQVLVITGLLFVLGIAPRPLPTGLIRWDAVWYNTIRDHGYVFDATHINNTAFFPLFPLFWRLTHLGAIGISIVNLLIGAGSLYLLWRGLRLRLEVVVLFAAFPSTLFLYLPYTEALFFFFSSLVVLGVARRREQPLGLLAGLLGGAITRVAAFFYLPALVVLEGVEWLATPGTFSERFRRLFGYGLVTGAGLASVVAYVWYQTGVWFAFNKSQLLWDHHFRLLPHLPFISTTENDGSLWLDGLAVLVGVVAIAWVLWVLVGVVRGTQPVPDRLLLFSAAYLAANVVQTVFNAPVEQGHSSLMSLSRYVFCTPFFLVVLDRLVPRQPVAWRTMALALGAIVLTAALVGTFTTKQFDIEWPTSKIPFLWGPVAGSAYALFMLAYGFLWLQTGTRWGRALVYVSSFALQIFFLYTYAVGHWVG